MIMLIAAYLVVWVASLLTFWLIASGSDAMGFSLVFLWGLLPAATLVVSILMGKRDYGKKWKWIAPPIFGVLYMLNEYATFEAANMAAFGKINLPRWGMILAGALISLAGLGIGVGVKKFREK